MKKHFIFFCFRTGTMNAFEHAGYARVGDGNVWVPIQWINDTLPEEAIEHLTTIAIQESENPHVDFVFMEIAGVMARLTRIVSGPVTTHLFARSQTPDPCKLIYFCSLINHSVVYCFSLNFSFFVFQSLQSSQAHALWSFPTRQLSTSSCITHLSSLPVPLILIAKL